MWFLGTFILFLTLVLDASLAGGRKIDKMWVSSKSGVTLREKPNTKSSKLLIVPFDTEVALLEKRIYKSNDTLCEAWFKIKWMQQEGYSCITYLLPIYEPFREFEFNIEKAIKMATSQFKQESKELYIGYKGYESPIANSINFIDWVFLY